MMPITSRLVMVAAFIKQVVGNRVEVHGAKITRNLDARPHAPGVSVRGGTNVTTRRHADLPEKGRQKCVI